MCKTGQEDKKTHLCIASTFEKKQTLPWNERNLILLARKRLFQFLEANGNNVRGIEEVEELALGHKRTQN